MNADHIVYTNGRNRVTTNSNKFGIVLFCGLAMTNDNDINFNQLHTLKLKEISIDSPQFSSLENFSQPQNQEISLIADNQASDEQVILEFANKLLGSTQDIDPEISKVVQKRFWDMI